MARDEDGAGDEDWAAGDDEAGYGDGAGCEDWATYKDGAKYREGAGCDDEAGDEDGARYGNGAGCDGWIRRATRRMAYIFSGIELIKV